MVQPVVVGTWDRPFFFVGSVDILVADLFHIGIIWYICGGCTSLRPCFRGGDGADSCRTSEREG